MSSKIVRLFNGFNFAENYKVQFSIPDKIKQKNVIFSENGHFSETARPILLKFKPSQILMVFQNLCQFESNPKSRS